MRKFVVSFNHETHNSPVETIDADFYAINGDGTVFFCNEDGPVFDGKILPHVCYNGRIRASIVVAEESLPSLKRIGVE